MDYQDEIIDLISNMNLNKKLIEPPMDIETSYDICHYDDVHNKIKIRLLSDGETRDWSVIDFEIIYEVDKNPEKTIQLFWNSLMEKLI